jgi:phosphoribosylformimino-5-aminoimidazole carboxamide ribotide isomerase
MKVIPVLDLKGGVVVHAIRGRRAEYRPVKSILTASPHPLKVAEALRRAYGFQEAYIADLDAIEGVGDNLEHIAAIAEQGWRLLVDAGVCEPARARVLFDQGVEVLVVGTENLPSLDALERLAGLGELYLSLDYEGSRLRTPSSRIAALELEELVAQAAKKGASGLIVLDLLRVGSGEGPNLGLIGRAVKATELPVYVGGGIRGLEDLLRLDSLGVSGVLVATALHTGALKPPDIGRLQRRPLGRGP